ncbi:MAG TPA: metal-dependent hydrolase [Turneriella sp.]|nr:metal-dependent hydrolase [Turneriella sp.]
MTVRKNKETFAEPVPAHWAGKDALQSHVLNVLSLMFPDGEAFFIRSVKHFADRVTDQKMQADIKAFVGQEMQHSMAHERFNKQSPKMLATWIGSCGFLPCRLSNG